MKNYLTILFLFLFNIISFSQENIGFRQKIINFLDDSLKIDTLSIIPNSINIYDSKGNKINDKDYKVIYTKSIIVNNMLKCNTDYVIRYKVFSIDFSKSYYNKSLSLINSDTVKSNKKSKYYDFYNNNYFRYNTNNNMDKRGSISRGVSFGNNQDVIVNSNLNLQLSGKITDDLNVLATISDKNIPIQPDGSSQQIQDFDKVFISVFNDKTNLNVGDVILNYNESGFLKINKKLKGVIASNIFNLSKKTENKINLKSSVSAAVTKGKYANQFFYGTEGNQGPYKLSGADGETNIIILSGTEKVYIDGKLLVRGLENDYVINYNTGEISFTPNQIITKDKRINVEFEYSQQAYAQFLVFNNNVLKTQKGEYWLNIYSQNDSKNQSLQQTLTNDDKKMFSQIGDTLSSAYRLNVDSIAYSNDYVMYKKVDTVVNGKLNEIYIYSTNKDSAFYRLGFSSVGEGKGNYILLNSAANGRVFKWIVPINGQKQGSYEPIVLLVAPAKKQAINLGAKNYLSKTLLSNVEFIVSDNDKNTFSNLDKNDDFGYALKTSLEKNINLKNKSQISFGADYQLISNNFNPVDRFRSVEYNRDWNILKTNLGSQEQLISGFVNLKMNKSGFANYTFQHLDKSNLINANKNNINLNFIKNGYAFKTQSSYLVSKNLNENTFFIRDKIELSKKIKSFYFGGRHELENNKFIDKDSLLNNSYFYNQYEFFIEQVDSLKNKLSASYINRTDFLPKNNLLNKNSNSQDFLLSYNLTSLKNFNIKTIANYRNLSLFDTLLTSIKPEDNLNGRIEISSHFFKNTISSSSFYEIGSGLEVKKEFSYIEVTQGQGVYSWTDYNSNNIKELNEFEVAVYKDQANYIRVFIPTNEYIKTHYNQYNQVFNFNPHNLWKKKTGIRKFISFFSNTFAYNVNNKVLKSDFYKILNPLNSEINDSMLMTYNNSIRNIFSFNRTSQYFTVDYLIQRNANKILMINGFDSRDDFLQGLNFRWNILKSLTLLSKESIGNKTYLSEQFISKNYNINYLNLDQKLSFQPSISYRISFIYKYSNKKNITGELLELNNFGTELKYSRLKKGNLNLTFNYINIRYPYNANSSLGFEMLQGLMPGNNLTWEVVYQRSISKSLILNLNYNGRFSTLNDVIHTGGIQLRAYF